MRRGLSPMERREIGKDERVYEFEEALERLDDLIGEFEDILAGTGIIEERADAYWLGHLKNWLHGRGIMVSPQDTLDELVADEEDEDEED